MTHGWKEPGETTCRGLNAWLTEATFVLFSIDPDVDSTNLQVRKLAGGRIDASCNTSKIESPVDVIEKAHNPFAAARPHRTIFMTLIENFLHPVQRMDALPRMTILFDDRETVRISTWKIVSTTLHRSRSTSVYFVARCRNGHLMP